MNDIRTILFPSDLSPESDRALEHARFLAEQFGARLTIYHGLEMPRSELQAWTDAREDRRAEWERKVRQELERRAAGLTVPHEVVVEGGLVGGRFLVDLAILEMIDKTKPDLTVMATHSRQGFAAFFLGSVTAQVVQHAGRPVLCVRKAVPGPVPPYRRLLVPTDFSAASRRAFPVAALMARKFSAQVTALHVAPAPRLGATEEDLRRFLAPDFDGLPVEARVVAAGSAWAEIAKAAAQQEADLVVMATQGLDSVHDKVIGSNTERVLRHAACSVLVA